MDGGMVMMVRRIYMPNDKDLKKEVLRETH